MLKQRVITAIVLMAILLPALFASTPLPFTFLVLLLTGAAAWEWGRLNALGPLGSVLTAVACLGLCLVSWFADWIYADLRVVWAAATLVWVLGCIWLIKRGVNVWAEIPQWIRWIVGVLALWCAWLAMAQARQVGVNFLLSIMALVWCADIAAYFAGRSLGLKFFKVKLASSISPGKSWEGAIGGLIGVLVLGVIWVVADVSLSAVDKSFYSRIQAQLGWVLTGIALCFMASMSVIGDLVESLIKRSAGVKDSSQLLPGHGGVLDRIDALLPVMPIAMMLMTVVQ